jgi:hypothetical protein
VRRTNCRTASAPPALDDAISDRLGGKRDDERRFGEVRAELEAMQRTPQHPGADAEAARAPGRGNRHCRAALPFVGELIQVRSEEQGWQGAIERVLGGFALSVDDKHYNTMSPSGRIALTWACASPTTACAPQR